MLLGDGPLVADRVLELGPGVLEDRADLHLRAPAAERLVGRRRAAGRVDRHEQVPAGVAEPALARGLLPHVAVVEHPQLVAEQVRHRGDVAVQVGDHPDPDLVGDLLQRVGVERAAVDRAVGLRRERGDALRPSGHAEVVDAGVVEQGGHQRDEPLGHLAQLGLHLRVGAHRRTHRVVSRRAARAPVPRRSASDGSRGTARQRHLAGRQGRRDDVAGGEVAVRRGQVGTAYGEQRDVGADHRVDLVLGTPQLALALGSSRRLRAGRATPRCPAGAAARRRRRAPRGASSAAAAPTRSSASVRPGLFLYFSVRPRRNSATVAGCG